MRWWASLVVVAACHQAAQLPAAAPGTRTPGPAASCKVSDPVCDPAIGDDIALAVVRQRCAGCHGEGGAAAHPLLDPEALVRERGNIALRLSGCEMPPDDTPLPPAERARLIGWAACAPAAIAGARPAPTAGDREPDRRSLVYP